MPTTRSRKKQQQSDPASAAEEPVALELTSSRRKRAPAKTRGRSKTVKTDDEACAAEEEATSSSDTDHGESSEAEGPSSDAEECDALGSDDPLQSSLMLIDLSFNNPPQADPSPVQHLTDESTSSEQDISLNEALSSERDEQEAGTDAAATASSAPTGPHINVEGAEEELPQAPTPADSEDTKQAKMLDTHLIAEISADVTPKSTPAPTHIGDRIQASRRSTLRGPHEPILIQFESSPIRPNLAPPLVPTGALDTAIVQRDERIASLEDALKKRDAEINKSRKQLRQFATNLAGSLTGESAAPGTHGNAGRTSGIFGRFSIGPGADTTIGGDQSMVLADLTTNPGWLEDGSMTNDLYDDVDYLRVLWTEATQRFDFLRLEDNLRIQRLQRELEAASAQNAQSTAKEPMMADTEKEQLQEQLKAMSKKLKEQEETLAQRTRSTDEAIKALELAVAARDSELTQLRDELEVAQAQILETRKESDRMLELEQQQSAILLEGTSKELDKQRARIAQLEREVEEARTAAAQAAQLKSEEQQEEIEAQIQQLKDDLSAAEAQIASLTDQSKTREQQWEQERCSLEERIKDGVAEKETTAAQLLQLSKDLDEARQEAARVAELQAQLEQAQQHTETIAQLRAELDGQRDVLAAEQAAKVELEKQSMEYRVEVETKVQQAVENAHRLQAQLTEVEAALQAANTTVKEVQEHNSDLQRARDELEQRQTHDAERLRTLEARMQDLEGERDAAIQEAIKLRPQVACNEELLRQAKEDLENANVKLQSMRQERDALQQQAVSLEEAMAKSSKTSATSKDALDALHAQVAQLEADLAAERARAGQNNDLQLKITQLEDELALKAREIEDYDTKMLTSMKERKRLEVRCKKLQMKVDQAANSSPGVDAAVAGRSSPMPDALPAPLEPRHAGRGDGVRSPLSESNQINEANAQRSVPQSTTRSASGSATATSRTTSKAVDKAEAAPPTPWAVAVALSNKGSTFPRSGEVAKVRHSSTQSLPPATRVESRKRSSPDDVAEADAAAAAKGTTSSGSAGTQAPVTRAIYVPSPHRGSGFVPQRRSKTDLGAAATREGPSSASSTPSSAAATVNKERERATVPSTSTSTSRSASLAQLKPSAAERLAGRLASGPEGGRARPVGGVGSSAGSSSGGGGGGLSAKLAEIRARRAITQASGL